MKILDKLKSKDENTRIIIINAIGSFGVKGLSLLITLLTTPAYLRYFNSQEQLGIWFVVLSVLAWILNCDMGIGNGLRNKLVESLAERDNEKVKKYISSSYLFLAAMSVVVICIIVVLSQFISWNKVFNISTEMLDSQILSKAITILLLSLVLQFTLQLISSILYALQKAFVPGLFNFLTSLLMLLFVTYCNSKGENNDIVRLALAYLVSVNLPLLFATFIVFNTILKKAKPSIKYCEKNYAIAILKIGGAFLWLQIMAMVLNSTNNYLISLFINNAAVVEYQIYYKIFSLVGAVVLIITQPIWSAVTKAQSEKKYSWMKKLYMKLVRIGWLAVIGEFALVTVLQYIFNIWLQEKSIKVNYAYATMFAISGSVYIWSSIITCFANGLCELKIQTIFLTGGSLLNILMAYLFARLTNSYIAIIVANTIAILPYCIVQTIWFNGYLKKKINPAYA